jgi:hypothetical protein
MTDVLLAQMNGFFSIHVKPFDTSRDNIVVQLVRRAEEALAQFAVRWALYSFSLRSPIWKGPSHSCKGWKSRAPGS